MIDEVIRVRIAVEGSPLRTPPAKDQGAIGKRRFDSLGLVAAGFFLLAVGLAAVPAFRAGPATLAGLLLLAGLAGVAFVGLAAFRGLGRESPTAGEGELADLLAGIVEPAAACAADGILLAVNGAWREAMGGARRLPKSEGLFPALADALKGVTGEGTIVVGGVERPARVTPLGVGKLLLRLPPPPPAAAGSEAGAAGQAKTSPQPARLDPFAAASPFGAALIEGPDPLEGVILEANAALAGIVGAEAVKGARFGDLLASVSRDHAAASLAERRPNPYEVALGARAEKTAHLYLARAGARWVAYLLDVTDQKTMQLQLAQRNKMESIGQLAGGIAHDVNNQLTAINLQLDQLAVRHSLGDPSYENLSQIRETSNSIGNLVGQLLAFSRKTTIQRAVLDLGELISNFEVLLRRLLREDVRLVTEYGRNLPQIRADKTQLENAVINLVVNARDAVRAAGGGTIRMRTARLTASEAVDLGYTGGGGGDLALIEVSDDGPGIAAEVIGKIFDPFFTTKAVGEGTGLGLATVFGIVKQSDGWINVVSRPGEGAAFRIFLPVHIAPLTVETPAPAGKTRIAPRDLSGAGRILFVEDDVSVRHSAALLLRARGYEVLEAADGEEALVLAEKHAGTIDLMISDVIMPGIDGPTLLRKARPFLGAAPVMFISGYAEAEFSDFLEGETGVSFLAKPIDIKSLSQKVKQQLAAA
jgi:two-component system cell cycle sensor histidine kinase/response regulator CckA